MDQTKLNTVKVLIAYIVLIAFYSFIIKITRPWFENISPLVYISIAILLGLAIFLLVPFLIFQFRGKE